MSGAYFLGLDGGGSHLRVALCDDTMQPLVQREYGPANPGSIGQAAARAADSDRDQ